MADLENLLHRLIDHHVEFVVVGGFAAVAHGVSLLTQDIDICCSFAPDNLLKIGDALKDLKPVHRMTPQRLPLDLTADSCKGLRNLYLDTTWGQLDCISEVKGIGQYDTVREQVIELDLDGRRCLILDIPALIAAKDAMGRPRDKEAVTELRAIRERLINE